MSYTLRIASSSGTNVTLTKPTRADAEATRDYMHRFIASDGYFDVSDPDTGDDVRFYGRHVTDLIIRRKG